MTATFEHTRKPALAAASALSAKAEAIKGAVRSSWPPVVIALGFALTLAWSGTLLLLFARMILDLI